MSLALVALCVLSCAPAKRIAPTKPVVTLIDQHRDERQVECTVLGQQRRADLARYAFSSERVVISAGKQLSTWDIDSGSQLETIAPLSPRASYLATSATGHRVVTGQSLTVEDPLPAVLQVWDIEDRKVLLRLVLPGKPSSIDRQLRFSPDGQSIVSVRQEQTTFDDETRAYDGELIVWDATSGERRWSLPASHVWVMAISPDSKLLAAYVARATPKRDETGRVIWPWVERAIHIWDLETGSAIASWDVEAQELHALAFSTDARTLAAGVRFNDGAKKAGVIWWNVESGEVGNRLQLSHKNVPTLLSYSADGTRLGIACHQGTRAHIVDVEASTVLLSMIGDESRPLLGGSIQP